MTSLFQNRQTKLPLDYQAWNKQYGVSQLFGIDATGQDIASKLDKAMNNAVDPENYVPLPAELDDLIRLHFLCINRRVTTVLEFGVGKSTLVFADALARNEAEHGDYVKENLRRATPFQLFTLDNAQQWLDKCRQDLPADYAKRVTFAFSEVKMTTFNDRICTVYEQLPNVCPDLIYIDGPGQYEVKGDVNGITTATKDRVPMSADVLRLEPFLLPGTLIVLDGRTANARFLKNNFQGNWEYQWFPDLDIHTFELKEAPLGRINERQLTYCLSPDTLQEYPKHG